MAEEVKGVDIDGTEYVQVQVGHNLFRDGGPYGDQADAIRDERYNAAREGREPNFDALVPDQYKLRPKEEVRKQTYAPESQRTNFGTDEVVTDLPTADYAEGQPEQQELETVKPSEGGEQTDSENVAKALGESDNDPFKL